LVGNRLIDGFDIAEPSAIEVPDALRSEPRAAEMVANDIGADPVAFERLLRALATIGITEQRADGEFTLTPLGALLRKDATDSLRNPVLLMNGPNALRSWGELPNCVRTGDTATKLLHDSDDPFAPFDADPAQQAIFDAAMAEGTRQMADAIAAAYDFARMDTIVDVGGGYGALLPPILRRHLHLRGVVFDRPHCRAGAKQLMRQEGITARCTFAGGDFFVDDLPAGADAYVLKSVIHDWDDERSIAVLRRCRDAMRDDSRVLVVETTVPDRLDQSPAHRRIVSADLRMLIATGGRERTRGQYATLFEAAGLRLADVHPTGAPLDIIEAFAA
jgi:hypothetical protein